MITSFIASIYELWAILGRPYTNQSDDRKTFIKFLDLLRQDYLNNPDSWENKTLPDFLASLRNYAEDIQGYYDNMLQDVNADYPTGKLSPTFLKVRQSMRETITICRQMT